MAGINLKSCPFCENDALLLTKEILSRDNYLRVRQDKMYRCECSICHIHTEWEPCMETAINAWNMRADNERKNK